MGYLNNFFKYFISNISSFLNLSASSSSCSPASPQHYCYCIGVFETSLISLENHRDVSSLYASISSPAALSSDANPEAVFAGDLLGSPLPLLRAYELNSRGASSRSNTPAIRSTSIRSPHLRSLHHFIFSVARIFNIFNNKLRGNNNNNNNNNIYTYFIDEI